MAGELFSDLAAVVGLPAALGLCRARGGQVVYIPRNLHEGHWLVAATGSFSAALALTARWAGDFLTLPLGPEAGSRNALHRQVMNLAEAGASVNNIARATGLTARAVQRIKKRGGPRPAPGRRVDPRQGNLFEDLEV